MIVSPVDTKPQSPEQDPRRRLVQVAQERQADEEPTPPPVPPPQPEETPGESSMSTHARRARQRKLSYSDPQPQRENSVVASSTLHSELPRLAIETRPICSNTPRISPSRWGWDRTRTRTNRSGFRSTPTRSHRRSMRAVWESCLQRGSRSRSSSGGNASSPRNRTCR